MVIRKLYINIICCLNHCDSIFKKIFKLDEITESGLLKMYKLHITVMIFIHYKMYVCQL